MVSRRTTFFEFHKLLFITLCGSGESNFIVVAFYSNLLFVVLSDDDNGVEDQSCGISFIGSERPSSIVRSFSDE